MAAGGQESADERGILHCYGCYKRRRRIAGHVAVTPQVGAIRVVDTRTATQKGVDDFPLRKFGCTVGNLQEMRCVSNGE